MKNLLRLILACVKWFLKEYKVLVIIIVVLMFLTFMSACKNLDSLIKTEQQKETNVSLLQIRRSELCVTEKDSRNVVAAVSLSVREFQIMLSVVAV